MDMELLNAISEMIAKNNDILRQEINGLRQEMKQNNDSLRQEMKQNNDTLRQEMKQNNDTLRQEMKQNNDTLRQEMLEDHNRLFNQFSALVEEKVTKEIHLVAEGHAALLEKLDNRASVSELKEVKSDLATVYDSTIKHRKRIEKLESEVKALKKAN